MASEHIGPLEDFFKESYQPGEENFLFRLLDDQIDVCRGNKKLIETIQNQMQPLKLKDPRRKELKSRLDIENPNLAHNLSLLSSTFSEFLDRVRMSYGKFLENEIRAKKWMASTFPTSQEWKHFLRNDAVQNIGGVYQTVEAFIERFLEATDIVIPTEGEHAHILYYRHIGDAKKGRGEFFVNEDKSYDARYVFVRNATGWSFLSGTRHASVDENPLGFFDDALNRRVRFFGRGIDSRRGLFFRGKGDQVCLSLEYGQTKDPSTTYRCSADFSLVEGRVLHSVRSHFFSEEKAVFFSTENTVFEGIKVALLQDLENHINFRRSSLEAFEECGLGGDSKDDSRLKLSRFEDLKRLFVDLFTDDVVEEATEEVSVSVGADGRATVTTSAKLQKKKVKSQKKGRKISGAGAGAGAGFGKGKSKAESDDEDGAAGGGGAAVAGDGTVTHFDMHGVTLTAPHLSDDTMILDSQETVTVKVEEDGVKVLAEGTVEAEEAEKRDEAEESKGDDAPPLAPPSLARTASVKSDGGGIDRDSKVKIMNLTQELMTLAEGRKRFKVREYVSIIEKAFGLSGLTYRVVKDGSHRIFHIDGIGSVQFVVSHGRDGAVPAHDLRTVAESVGDAAVFAAAAAEKQKGKAGKKGKGGKK